MHQEISKREKISAIKVIISIIIVAIILIGFNTLVVTLGINSSITDVMIIFFTVTMTYLFIKQYMISYKYSLIEDEFIIYEVIGSKEKLILDMNVHQISKMANVSSSNYENDFIKPYYSRKKLYNCTNVDNRHYLIYEEDERTKWVTIQPSDYMVELLKDLQSRKG